MIMTALPEIAKDVAEPLSKVDEISMYGKGNSAKKILYLSSFKLFYEIKTKRRNSMEIVIGIGVVFALLIFLVLIGYVKAPPRYGLYDFRF